MHIAKSLYIQFLATKLTTLLQLLKHLHIKFTHTFTFTHKLRHISSDSSGSIPQRGASNTLCPVRKTPQSPQTLAPGYSQIGNTGVR